MYFIKYKNLDRNLLKQSKERKNLNDKKKTTTIKRIAPKALKGTAEILQ